MEPLTERNFQSLKEGDHLIHAPSGVGFTVSYVVKAANGIVMHVEIDDDYGPLTLNLYPDNELANWAVGGEKCKS